MVDLEKALADLHAIGARFSPQAAIGNDIAAQQGIDPSAGPAHPELVGMEQPGGMLAPPQPQIHNPALMGFGDPDMAPAPAPRPDVSVAPSQLSPSMQGGMAAAQAAPQDPYAPGAPGQYPTTIQQADARVEQEANTLQTMQTDADQKAMDAKAGHQKALADFYDQDARDQATEAVSHEHNIAQISARNDFEQAQWLQEQGDLAKKEPNPHRYWENASGLSKALWALGIISGAGYVALTPGAQNAALRMYDDEVNRDVALQEARLKRETALGELKGKVMESRHARNLTDEKDRYARLYQRHMAVERAFTARNDMPSDLDAAAKKQAGIAHIQETYKFPLAQQRRTERFQTDRAVEDRRHAASMQANSQKFTADQNKLDRDAQMARLNRQGEIDLDKAPVSMSLGQSAGSARNPRNKDGEPMYRELQSGPGTGVVLMGRDGKPAQGDGIMFFRKEDRDQWEKAGHVVEAANNTYTARKRLREELAKLDPADRALNAVTGPTSPVINALIEEAGYGKASEQNKIVTDKDKSSGVQQVIGFDANGNWLQRGKFNAKIDDVIAKIDDDLNAMPTIVNNQVGAYNAGELNGHGSKLIWSPKFLRGPEVEERSQDDIRGKTKEVVPVPGAYTVDNYAKGQARKADEKASSPLPEHDPSFIKAIISNVEGKAEGKATKTYRAPADIEAEAARVIGELDKRIAATNPDSFTLGRDPTPEDVKEWNRLKNTKVMAESIAEDAAKKAQAVLDKFETHINQSGNWKGYTDESLRNKARAMGLRAPAEVDALIEKYNHIRQKSTAEKPEPSSLKYK